MSLPPSPQIQPHPQAHSAQAHTAQALPQAAQSKPVSNVSPIVQSSLLALVTQLAQKASTTPEGKAQADQILSLVKDISQNRLSKEETKDRILALKS